MRGTSLARLTGVLSASLLLGCGDDDDQYRVDEDVATPQAAIGAAVSDETDAEGAESLTQTTTRLEALQRAVAEYAARTGTLPATIQELVPPTPSPPGDLPATADAWWQDGWGSPILYERVGTARYQLRSIGPDLVAGTGDDIVRDGVLGP